MPAFLLKRQILMNLPSDNLEVEVANSIDFMVERVSDCVIFHLQMELQNMIVLRLLANGLICSVFLLYMYMYVTVTCNVGYFDSDDEKVCHNLANCCAAAGHTGTQSVSRTPHPQLFG